MTQQLIQANSYIAENFRKVNPRYKNKLHMSSPIGWINDPNGFNYAFGKYHLFFQFHPYSAEWGPMHWGHCVTDDFISWEYLPVALAPDTEYDRDGCFSGSSYFDGENLYLLYTAVCGNMQRQALAVSSDGVNFKKLGVVIGEDGLPADVKKSDFRDPKIFTCGGKYYCLVGATDKSGKGRILSFASRDMKGWEYLGDAVKDTRTNVCECPDYFKLDGKEVLIYSPQFLKTDGVNFQNEHSNVYSFGKFDLRNGAFEISREGEIDGGFDFYAAQTLSALDGRRIMVAWMSMWDRTPVTASDGWSGAMIIPRELSVDGNRLLQQPVREIERYRRLHFHIDKKQVSGDVKLPDFGAAQDISVTCELGAAQRAGFKLFCGKNRFTLVYYDREKDLIIFDRTRSGAEISGGSGEKDALSRSVKAGIKDGILKIRLILDVSSCEAFFGKGENVLTANIYGGGTENYFFSDGGIARIQRLDAYSLEINKNKKNKSEEK